MIFEFNYLFSKQLRSRINLGKYLGESKKYEDLFGAILGQLEQLWYLTL
jgi:hypothetical protein